MQRRWIVIVGASAMAWPLAAPLGCQPSPVIAVCDELPDPTACPTGRGGTCKDPECSALYECVEGTWERVQICEQNHAGGGGAGQGGQGAQGGCLEVPIDTDSPFDGCGPDLQPPDCPVEAASACQPCTTGCLDFFSCDSDGWTLVAYCDEDGAFVVAR